jgi:hypothetical protein
MPDDVVASCDLGLVYVCVACVCLAMGVAHMGASGALHAGIAASCWAGAVGVLRER